MAEPLLDINKLIEFLKAHQVDKATVEQIQNNQYKGDSPETNLLLKNYQEKLSDVPEVAYISAKFNTQTGKVLSPDDERLKKLTRKVLKATTGSSRPLAPQAEYVAMVLNRLSNGETQLIGADVASACYSPVAAVNPHKAMLEMLARFEDMTVPQIKQQLQTHLPQPENISAEEERRLHIALCYQVQHDDRITAKMKASDVDRVQAFVRNPVTPWQMRDGLEFDPYNLEENLDDLLDILKGRLEDKSLFTGINNALADDAIRTKVALLLARDDTTLAWNMLTQPQHYTNGIFDTSQTPEEFITDVVNDDNELQYLVLAAVMQGVKEGMLELPERIIDQPANQNTDTQAKSPSIEELQSLQDKIQQVAQKQAVANAVRKCLPPLKLAQLKEDNHFEHLSANLTNRIANVDDVTSVAVSPKDIEDILRGRANSDNPAYIAVQQILNEDRSDYQETFEACHVSNTNQQDIIDNLRAMALQSVYGKEFEETEFDVDTANQAVESLLARMATLQQMLRLDGNIAKLEVAQTLQKVLLGEEQDFSSLPKEDQQMVDVLILNMAKTGFENIKPDYDIIRGINQPKLRFLKPEYKANPDYYRRHDNVLDAFYEIAITDPASIQYDGKAIDLDNVSPKLRAALGDTLASLMLEAQKEGALKQYYTIDKHEQIHLSDDFASQIKDGHPDQDITAESLNRHITLRSVQDSLGVDHDKTLPIIGKINHGDLRDLVKTSMAVLNIKDETEATEYVAKWLGIKPSHIKSGKDEAEATHVLPENLETYKNSHNILFATEFTKNQNMYLNQDDMKDLVDRLFESGKFNDGDYKAISEALDHTYAASTIEEYHKRPDANGRLMYATALYNKTCNLLKANPYDLWRSLASYQEEKQRRNSRVAVEDTIIIRDKRHIETAQLPQPANNIQPKKSSIQLDLAALAEMSMDDVLDFADAYAAEHINEWLRKEMPEYNIGILTVDEMEHASIEDPYKRKQEDVTNKHGVPNPSKLLKSLVSRNAYKYPNLIIQRHNQENTKAPYFFLDQKDGKQKPRALFLLKRYKPNSTDTRVFIISSQKEEHQINHQSTPITNRVELINDSRIITTYGGKSEKVGQLQKNAVNLYPEITQKYQTHLQNAKQIIKFAKDFMMDVCIDTAQQDSLAAIALLKNNYTIVHENSAVITDFKIGQLVIRNNINGETLAAIAEQTGNKVPQGFALESQHLSGDDDAPTVYKIVAWDETALDHQLVLLQDGNNTGKE